MSETNRVSPSKTILASVLLGVLAGGLQALVRAFVLIAIGAGSNGHAAWLTLSEAKAELPLAMGLGALGGLLAWALLLRSGGRSKAAVLYVVLTLALIALGGAGLLGEGQAMAGGTTAIAVLLVGTLPLALLLVHTLAFLGSRSADSGKFQLSFGLLLIAATAFFPGLVDMTISGKRPVMEVQEVRREVILVDGAWEVLQSNPKLAPYVGVLMPSRDYRVDAGELPSLIMPPPCSVSFEITEEDGPVLLEIAGGIDESINWVNKNKRKENYLDIEAFRFEIEVNGKKVFEVDEPWIATGKRKGIRNPRTWLRPDVAAGLELNPGDKVVLRTALVGPSREKVLKGRPVLIGFGNVLLTRRLQYERQLADPDSPSIVLIVQDTLRADRCSTYGYERETTPALTKLANRGILFSEAHSAASWTWPATASILTGLQPDTHGVTDDSSCYLVSQNETLAEVLQQRGYTTSAFACNPLVSTGKNFSQGFEYFWQSGKRFKKTSTVIEPIEQWLVDNGHLRFFLYLHLVDPHMPHEPSKESEERLADVVPEGFGSEKEVHKLYKGRALRGNGVDENGELVYAEFPEGHIEYMSSMYDASVATGDEYLAQIVEILERLGLDENTIVVFTSDHGEAWMDHGGLTHGDNVHRELVAVPLVMAGPGLPAGVVCETPISNRFIATTLAAIGGAELSNVPDAIVLTDIDTIPAQAVFFSTTHGNWNNRMGRQPIYGVREGKWVLHFAPEGTNHGVAAGEGPVGGQMRLYDVSVDPNERNNLAEQHSELAERLKLVILDNLAEQIKSKDGRLDVGGGAETMRMLDGIGYNVGRLPDPAEESDSE